MDYIRKYDWTLMLSETPQNNLRMAIRAYLNNAIISYVKIEAIVSLWSYASFGDSANIVCSLSRAIEHLLKLRLIKIDPLLLYPLPKQVKDYCRIKQIKTKNDTEAERKKYEKESLSHTISFKDALERVDLTQNDTDYNFKCFKEIYALRNSLEHHWDRNEEFLKKVIGNMSSTIIPCIKEFIKDILEENADDYFDSELLNEVDHLDKAIEHSRSLAHQKEIEDYSMQYKQNPETCIKEHIFPEKYSQLDELELDLVCPICEDYLTAYWDWEADYDVEGGEAFITGAFPDHKCIFCKTCHFLIEGGDMDSYLPDGINIQPEDEEYL